MKAKIHLIVISAIIVVMLLLWYVMYGSVERKPPIVVKGYAIEIVRASYGLECINQSFGQNQVDPYGSAGSAKKDLFKENNVLEKVAGACNGHPLCDINIKNTSLGMPDATACSSKILQIDFRCFKLDRIRKVSQYEGEMLTIDCSKI